MSSVNSTLSEQGQKVIADWVGDVVALESHIEEAMDRQLQLKSDNAELTAAIQRFHDYTAYNLAAVSYSMLHTTAMALGDARTQQFAGEGLRTYASLVQDINRVIPLAVAVELQENGDIPSVDASVIDNCRAFIDSAWKSTAH